MLHVIGLTISRVLNYTDYFPVLKKFAKKYNCALLADVRVKMGDKEHIFEHILLGSFGAVCVRTMTEMGEIYGNEDDVEFVVVDRN